MSQPILEDEMELKFQLVSEICLVPKNGCSHGDPTRQPFVDWYRLLRVEEDAVVDVIRKQYLKFALQLHPDKNKHPMAEMAFKLVSEAYSCLSDNAKRQVFNQKRWKNLCTQCNNKNPPTIPNCANPTSTRMKKSLKDMRERFIEEVKVIDKCMRAKESTSTRESPVFTPSTGMFQSHYNRERRDRRESPIFGPSNDMYYVFVRRNNGCYRRSHCESPVFEMRSDHRPLFRTKSSS